MTYEEICDYIYEIPKFTKKNGLAHTKELLRRLHIMEQRFKIIHVAGSNGKGSVCAFINQALREQEASVGMFTSPHLVCMEERFVIDGQRCTREEFAEAFHAVMEVVEGMVSDGLFHPSFFELLFAMGMYIFQKRNVKYLILETGLGGRLDTTNIFEEPLMTIITSISPEHTQILGDTIEEIAAEKAGIIKEGVPVVFDGSSEAAAQVIMHTARAKRAPFYRIPLESIKFRKITGKYIDFYFCTGYDGIDLRIPFVAEYQMMNAALAYKALEVLQTQTHIMRPQIAAAMAKTRWPGRMQQVAEGVYFDGAHNTDGIRHLLKSVKEIGGVSPMLLFAMVDDKDYEESVAALCQDINWGEVIVTKADDVRGLDTGVLRNEFAKHGQQVTVIDGSENAYYYAIEQKKEAQALFCAGSLYLIGKLETITGGC